MRAKLDNERKKREYLEWLREAKGQAEATIVAVERALGLYDEFTDDEPLARFNRERAIGFKEWLRRRKHRGKLIASATVYHTLRHAKDFFAWLATQHGYRAKLNPKDVAYLSLDKKATAMVATRRPVRYPSVSYVVALCDSVDVSTDVGLRDRALIAFLLLSGMRDRAVASLPLGCFDRETLVVTQDPSKGVLTKFSKMIQTTLLPFDTQLLQYVLEWSRHLSEGLLFSDADPLFPRTKLMHGDGSCSFASGDVEPVFWKTTGPIRGILKARSKAAGLEYFRPHSFRHGAIALARAACRNAQELKAVSQNFGHEHVGTTMLTYGTLDDRDVHDTVSNLNFGDRPDEQVDQDELLKAIKTLSRMAEKPEPRS